MRKFLLSLLALSILSMTAVANAKTIRIGTEGAYPPWNNINTAGELEGAEIDFGNEACNDPASTCSAQYCAADLPNTMRSSSELEPSRFAP